MNTQLCNRLLDDFKTAGIATDAKSCRYQLTLDFQDVIGNATLDELRAYYAAADKSLRQTMIWACAVCLSVDSLLSILKEVVCDDIIQENENALQKELQDKFDFVVSCSKGIDGLQAENVKLKARVKGLEEWLYETNGLVRRFRERAGKFDKIKSLLS